MDLRNIQTSKDNNIDNQMDENTDHSDDDLNSTKSQVIDSSSVKDFLDSESGSDDSSDDDSSPPKGTFIHPRAGPPILFNNNIIEEAARRLRCSTTNTDNQHEEVTSSMDQPTSTVFLNQDLFNYSREREQQMKCLLKVQQKLKSHHEHIELSLKAMKAKISSQSVNKILPEASLKTCNQSADDEHTSSVESTVENQSIPPANFGDMIPIGSGQTLIPRNVYNQINWNSYSTATIKLLMAVFPRTILATHTLKGKSPPPLSNRAPEMQLDATKINDIVMVVEQRCSVPESLIRNTITTKCWNESKIYRIRQENPRKRKRRDD